MIKVAAYCRVSTDREDQSNSFASQKLFFREYIQRHPTWQLHEVYADEGITGTSTRKRVQFNRMMNDAHRNLFQLIITKEVSRFSRNILDTIAFTRELKSLGIGVIFMSDGFSTLDPDAELRLSIMGSIAQEESRKTSSRVKWGQTRQMERGVVFGTSLLGYDVKNGMISVNPVGAEIVKLIFYKYGVEKKGTRTIARELREAGYRTYFGNSNWSDSHILKILKNEKYVGDLVQKKTITPDYLTHRKKYNHGEENLIKLKNHHEAIISRELWNLVQEEILQRHRRKNSSGGHSNRYIFSGKIICAECGRRFVSRKKVSNNGKSYRCWGCLTASRDGRRKTDIQGNILGCNIGKQIRDDLAIDMLKYVITHLNAEFDRIIKNLSCIVYQVLKDTMTTADSPQKICSQIEQIREKKTRAIDSYLSGKLTIEEFQNIKMHYDADLFLLEERYNEVKNKNTIGEEERFAELQQLIESTITCQEISEPYLKALLEYMIIHQDGIVTVKLNQLPTIWKFQLYKKNPHIPDLQKTQL